MTGSDIGERNAGEIGRRWFGESVRDIRMLRIEENNDLGTAIE